jgi:hypothetical protein
VHEVRPREARSRGRLHFYFKHFFQEQHQVEKDIDYLRHNDLRTHIRFLTLTMRRKKFALKWITQGDLRH